MLINSISGGFHINWQSSIVDFKCNFGVYVILATFCSNGRSNVCWQVLQGIPPSRLSLLKRNNSKLFSLQCVDDDDTVLAAEIVPNVQSCFDQNYTLVNSLMNFDDVLSAYSSLFQIATFKGWMSIIGDAVDSRVSIYCSFRINS